MITAAEVRGGAPRGRVPGVVAQKAVGRHGVIDVVRPFLAPLDLPGGEVRHVQQGLDERAQFQVPAGEQAARPLGAAAALAGRRVARVTAARAPARAFGGRLRREPPPLPVNAPAGLDAAAAQAALAAHIA